MTTRTLFDWFRASVDASPDEVALESGEVTMTYAELAAAAQLMSAAMTEATGGTPARVGLLSSRSLVGCVAYLASQRLGAITVPLNPANHVERNKYISDTAEVDLVVIDDSSGDGLSFYKQAPNVVTLDMTGDHWTDLRLGSRDVTVPPAVQRCPDDVAYVIFTSGTSGRPKGVPITHANVSAFLETVIPRYQFAIGARVAQTFEMAFDGSILAMFGAWGSGATLCLAQRRDVLTPVKFINANRLTHWLSVPSLISFAQRLRALPAGSMPTLTLSSFGGESLALEQVRAWAAAAPNTSIINCYGPTETTVIVTANSVSQTGGASAETSNGSVPIGDVFPHLEHLVLDERLEPSDDGELCIRGAQRFPGYLDPAENVGRFMSFDGVRGNVYEGGGPLTAGHWYRTGDRVRRERGELVHIGRIDDQIQVMGHRVELAEIEATLRQHPSIVDAVAVPVTAEDGEMDLHALYTGELVGQDELARLLAQLPVYMRPRHLHHRDEIPLTTSDKVDRTRLAQGLIAGESIAG
jgi:amino acid adenylation domain-containing protein